MEKYKKFEEGNILEKITMAGMVSMLFQWFVLYIPVLILTREESFIFTAIIFILILGMFQYTFGILADNEFNLYRYQYSIVAYFTSFTSFILLYPMLVIGHNLFIAIIFIAVIVMKLKTFTDSERILNTLNYPVQYKKIIATLLIYDVMFILLVVIELYRGDFSIPIMVFTGISILFFVILFDVFLIFRIPIYYLFIDFYDYTDFIITYEEQQQYEEKRRNESLEKELAEIKNKEKNEQEEVKENSEKISETKEETVTEKE